MLAPMTAAASLLRLFAGSASRAPPPAAPHIPWGTPLLPAWAPTYNISLSTAIEPCNYSGFFDLDFASRFGYVDW
eukprot:SAG31_NODE_16710_length_699_cov_0.688333_2_plen_75_part_00